MGMTNTALNTALRNDVLRAIMEFVSDKYDADALSVSSSAITFPIVDAEGNGKFAKITVSIPRGTRNGNGGYDEFDGYAAAEDYKMEVEDKAAKKAASEAKKAAKIKADAAKREAKKVVKELNEKGLDGMVKEGAE